MSAIDNLPKRSWTVELPLGKEGRQKEGDNCALPNLVGVSLMNTKKKIRKLRFMLNVVHLPMLVVMPFIQSSWVKLKKALYFHFPYFLQKIIFSSLHK